MKTLLRGLDRDRPDPLPQPVPLTLTSAQAAAYVGYSRSVWTLAKARGELPAPRRTPGGPRYRRKDLDEYVDRLKAHDTNLPRPKRG